MTPAQHSVRCTCGSIEFLASGAPILTAACYCDDCQQGARQIEALPNASPVAGADGGTEYLLYRKDRVVCTRRNDLVRHYRLKVDSPTVRAIATCCNSALFLDFQKGHWLSLYRSRCVGTPPPLQMCTQTKFARDRTAIRDDVLCYSTYPLKFIGKLIAARIAMLLRR